MVVGEFTQEVQLAVIGAGPGGYAAAFRAAELGVEASIIDPRDTLGGVCLHSGCVPSKTLAHIARTIRIAHEAEQFGVSAASPTVDAKAVRGWIDRTIASLAKGLASRAQSLGVEHLAGEASFASAKTLAVRGGTVPRIKFRRAIIATGASPIPHPALPLSHDRIWSPQRALAFDSIPATLLVVGCDYIALELAQMFATLGSRVTLVTEHNRWLPEADADVIRPVERRMRDALAGLATQTTIASADCDDTGVTIVFDGNSLPDATRFDAVIVALGQTPNTASLDLKYTDVATDDGGAIVVDEQMRTADPRILAVGDVTGGPMLADRALHQGRVAGEVVAGRDSVFDAQTIPCAVFTDPQVAWCGLTEQDAAVDDIACTSIKLPWGASGLAAGMARTDGVTKLIYDPASELVLGVGIAGVGASELIAEAALAIEMGATLTDLAATVHPHPTRSELLSDAAAQALSRNGAGLTEASPAQARASTHSRAG